MSIEKGQVIHHELLFNYDEFKTFKYLCPLLDTMLKYKWEINRFEHRLRIVFDTDSMEEYYAIIQELCKYARLTIEEID